MDDDIINPAAPDADGEEEEKDVDPDMLEDTFDDIDAL